MINTAEEFVALRTIVRRFPGQDTSYSAREDAPGWLGACRRGGCESTQWYRERVKKPSETRYWYTECPFCHQGRLLIARDTNRGALYLYCEECEHAWWDPERLQEPNSWFITLTEDLKTDHPSKEEIDAMGWGRYRLHSFED